MSEKKRPNRTSDEAREKTKKVDGKEGIERLADFTRRILRVGRAEKQPS